MLKAIFHHDISMIQIEYNYEIIVENGVELYGMDGKDFGVGARGMGGATRTGCGATLQRVPHACARHYLPDD